jgi:hypothetical protein
MTPQYDAKLRAECGTLTPHQSQRYLALAAAGALKTTDPLFKKQQKIAYCRTVTRRRDRLRAILRHSTAMQVD